VKVPVPAEILPADQLGRVHFVGIGGAGLSGIARIMLGRGMAVSGSDARDSPTLEALRVLGARVDLGHEAAHVADVDTLVVSTAVREDNPEYLEAVRQGLRILPRSAALAAVMSGRRVLAVAGTHGKTTTTSLLTVALQAAGADPTYAVGGDLAATGRNAEEGSGFLFVAEADESDGAFLVYRPHAAIVTNVEADHLDNWGTEEAYRAAFVEFLDRIDPAEEGGFLVCCVDDAGAAELARTARARGITVVGVGESADADVRATDLRFAGTTSTFAVHDGDALLGEITLQIPGRHYVLDALAALAVGLRLGHSFADLRTGLEGFTGTRRRMERKGEAGGVRVYDSYAHTRSRSPATSRPPARWRGRAAWWWPTSRTSCPAPASSAPPWARRWGRPTRSSCSTSTSRARTPTPRSPGRSSPGPCRCRPSGWSSSPTSTPCRPSSSRAPGPATWS